jgi:RNA polymerase sigma factor (sigma-70 family)
MMRTPSGSPPRELQSLFSDGVATGLTDQELLERFASCRDEAGEFAFATLLARHGPMVMNVCRRMLRNPADADDAFQATFLVLVRRAAAVRVGTSLAPWLYGVSVRVARRARDQGSRRRGVEFDERSAESITQDAVRGDHDVRLLIDEELLRLPANFRAAIVSCYLEGMTHEEAAVRLRCPVGTVRSRLSRGRALLKDRLERAGLGLDARRREPLAFLALGRAESIVSSHLIDSTARTAARLAAGQSLAALVPDQLAQLVAGACSTMTIFKMTVAISLFTLASLAAGGAFILGAQPQDDAPRVVVEAASKGTEPPPLTVALAPSVEAAAPDVDPMASYSYTIEPNRVHEYSELMVKFRDFQLTTGPVAVVPIDCERGTTGAVIIGAGKFQFMAEKGKSIEGAFRSVVLRFNPADQPAIISLNKGKKVTDIGAIEMCRHMLAAVLRHCYHRGNDVLIPAKGAIAAVLYSKDHGDLLISETGKEIVAYNFTNRKTIYQRK